MFEAQHMIIHRSSHRSHNDPLKWLVQMLLSWTYF